MQRGSTSALRPYVAAVHARWLFEQPERRYRCLHGTLVFADISGFTPLTERLARRGRVGAEALTDVLNEVFDALLSVAAAHGGDLLKFGGDALLLLFDGVGHERRACAAAAGMQKALRPWRRSHTEAGAMSLRMSVGVATGDIHAYLVGELHRELIVGGPVVSAVVALESKADAGEILVDHAVAATLGPHDTSSTKDDGRLLHRAPVTPEWVGPGVAAVADVGVGVGVDVTDGVPLALREHLCSRIDDGEHRQAVLTFVQFTGLDALLASDGPAAVADALDDLVCRLQRACRDHGVCFLATDLDGDGGKLLLVAGAPAALADDADRTLVTLLDVVAAPSPLRVRAGVNAGPAFAVDVGSRTRRTYAVMGDATNLAARVMGKAGPGQVVATEAVLERTRTPFEHQPLPAFLVKGKSLPVSASIVLGVGRHRRPAEHDRVQLVGRSAERALLAELAEQCRAGHGGVLTFVGEAGIGKSALVDHFRAVAADLPHLDAAAAPYAQASPYYAVRAPLRQLLGLPADASVGDLRQAIGTGAADLLPWLPLLGVVVGIPVPDTTRTKALAPEFRRARAHEEVVALLARLLPGPAAIIVEDAHWVDEASAALLADVAAASAERGWAMILTRRPDPASAAAGIAIGREVCLGPLDADEVTALAGRALGELPAHVRVQMAQRCAGNPLFLLELLQAARVGADTDTLPDSLEALIAARIDALAPPERALVRRAAVFGHRFDPELLAGLVQEQTNTVTATLSRLDGILVAEQGGYRFAHALIRDAAYAALPYRQRRGLHHRAGELIEAKAGADAANWSGLLSLHFEQAQVHPKTWRYARIAAERARAQWAPAEACVLYQRALAAARAMAVQDAEVADVYEELADCAELAGSYVEAAQAYREARSRVRGDAARSAELCRKEGWVRERSGRYSAAVRWYRRGIRTLDGGEAGANTRTQLTLAEGAARLRQGRYREAVPLLHTAVDGAQRDADEATLAHAYYLLDWAYTDLGSPDALHYRELSLPIYRRLGNLAREGVVVSNLGIDAYFEGRWDEAVELYERGRVASNQAGDVVQAATAANNIGEVFSDQGRLDEARDMFRDALATWQRAPFPVGIWLATSNLGRVAARAGRFNEAQGLFEQARAGFAAIGADGYVVETLARQVERWVLAGEPVLAETLAEDTAARVKRIGGLGHLAVMLLRLRGCTAAQSGALGPARERLTEAVASAERTGNLFEQALALHTLGHITDGSEGEAHRACAAGLLERLDVRWLPPIPGLTMTVVP
jgi:class 3 adenylate cyclase/tetratricopeptide (TPR) repeat protein